MTQPTIRLKVRRTSVVRAKALIRFPAALTAQLPLLIDTTGGNRDITLSLDSLIEMLQGTFQPYEGAEQHITAAGPVAIGNGIGIVRVNQTVGAAITLNLPLAAAKTCPVLIADWKNDAGTNNITISPSGSEKIQGQSSWVIAGDGGSVFLRPVPGVGYVL